MKDVTPPKGNEAQRRRKAASGTVVNNLHSINSDASDQRLLDLSDLNELATTEISLHDFLVKFYSIVAPNKVANVSNVLQVYAGNYRTLLQHLDTKYGTSVQKLPLKK